MTTDNQGEETMTIEANKTNWNACPACGSSQIEGGSVSIEDREAIQEVSCLYCKAVWTEVYAAHARIDIHSPEKMFEVSFRYYVPATDTLTGQMLAGSIEAIIEENYSGRAQSVKVVG